MKKYARLPNKTASIIRLIVYLIPLLVAVQATLFGSLGLSQAAGTFPILNIGQFKIRIEEVLILGFFFLFSFGLAFIPKVRNKHRGQRRSSVGWLVIISILGMAQASIHGFIVNSPHNLTDTRNFFIPLLYFVFAMYSLRTIRLTQLYRICLASLLPMAVMLQASVFLPIEDSLNKISFAFGGVYGGFSPPLVLLILSCLALALMRFIYSRKNRFFFFLTILFLTAGLFARIYKPGWVGALSVFIISAVVLILGNEERGFSRWAQSRTIRAYVLLLSAVCLSILYIQAYKPSLVSDYRAEAIDRIMRYDAGGDISGNRFKMIGEAIDQARRSPVIGLGTGWWYEHKYEDGEIYNVPDHLIVTWILTRSGLVTLIPLVLLVIWYIRKGFRNCRDIKNMKTKPFVIACYISTLQMLVYSLFGDYFSFFEQQIFFWLFVAVVLTAPTHPDCNTFTKKQSVSLSASRHEGRSRQGNHIETLT